LGRAICCEPFDGGGEVNGTDQLRICLLGEFAASRDGEALDLGGRRQRAVLALLLLARGEVVPAERLVESLWGDRAPANAAGVLQSYVSHLRRRLQPGTAARARSAVIVSEGRGYAVRLSPEAVDAWRFEALLQQAGATADPRQVAALVGEALGLWHGPALADYADESWAGPEIVRLNELRSVAREQLLAARLELGESALLVPELEGMVAEEPLREERWRLLVLALYRARRQADALAALRRARKILADELGIDPGPGLRELEAGVLAQSPSLDAPRRPPVPAPTTQPVTVADDLVDRDKELAAVRAALDDLAAGEPRLLLIEGPAGIGKTRLLAEARRLAAGRSVRVLAARGSQLERAFGFGVVRQLFEPELTASDRRQVLLGGAASSARNVFDLVDGDQAEFAVLHGLYWLAVNMAESGPLMLAIDDVQWCDNASLRYLAFLVRRLEAVPVLVVATVRTGEDDVDGGLLAELALEPTALVLRPAPLSPEATASIVTGRLGAPASPLFTAACHRTTAGNPLLLRQLLRGLEADGVRPDAAHADSVVAVGSRAVSSMVLMRLRRLPRQVTAVARAAAVLGDGAPLPAVASLAEVAEPDAADALAVLTRAEIVKDEQPLAFVHPLVRDAVYRDLPAAQRELWHERAAQVLRGFGASEEQLGAHLLLAPRRADPDTVKVLRGAGRTSAARGATDSAVTYLRRALAEPPSRADRCDVVLELGMLESQLDGPSSAEHLRDAYHLLDDERRRAEVAIAVARTQVFAGPPGVATAFAREAAAAVAAELADHRQALRAIERISGFMHGVDLAMWRTTPAPEPSGDGPGARMLAAALACEAALYEMDRDRAIALARFALYRDRLWLVDNGLFWVVAAIVRMVADDDLGDFWHRARAHAHQKGSLFAVMSTNVWQGFWHWRRGELDEALACVVAALDQDRMWGGAGIAEPYIRSVEISCHLDRGDLAAARRAADEALAGPGLGEGARLLRLDVGRLLVAEGRHADALATLATLPTPSSVANPARDPWRGVRAAALHGLGRAPEALALVADEVALLRRWGAPTYLGAALRLQGELLGRDGVDQLREAVAVLTPTDAVVELARARCALGRAREVADTEAVPLLLAASEAACGVGARGVRDRAGAALRERGRPIDACGVERRLSDTERRILDLTAEGRSVREVAQQLFLTPGTVQAVLEASPEPPP
jgi:DNA-binding SARP family transcriptional activator/tetratricopeptide (TPR) repeat protein